MIPITRKCEFHLVASLGVMLSLAIVTPLFAVIVRLCQPHITLMVDSSLRAIARAFVVSDTPLCNMPNHCMSVRRKK